MLVSVGVTMAIVMLNCIEEAVIACSVPSWILWFQLLWRLAVRGFEERFTIRLYWFQPQRDNLFDTVLRDTYTFELFCLDWTTLAQANGRGR